MRAALGDTRVGKAFVSECSLSYAVGMAARARALTPQARRDSLIAATMPLLREHGREVTTRQIACAAAVAEGTIFRVFASKEELVDAAIAAALDPEPHIAAVAAVDRTGSLEDLMLRLTLLAQERLRGVFELMAAIGMVGPPEYARPHGDWYARLAHLQEEILAPHADELRVPVAEALHVLRLLTFAGTHSHIAKGRELAAEHIVDLVLNGIRKAP